MWKWSVVAAGFLLFLGTAAVWAAECGPGDTLETVTGMLEYDEVNAGYVDSPYSLNTPGRDFVLYPDGPYFGMKWDDPGYVENALAKLSGFVGRQVRVTGCTSTTSDGQFHDIGNISQVMLA